MVTVLMPTYNCAEFISDAIASILNQTFGDFEFLIIDDGSTDNTEEVIERFKDPRIKYVKKSHSGLAESLNYGLRLSKYDLIARMDADDISHPKRFEKQINYIKSNTNITILSCWAACFNKNRILYPLRTPTKHSEIKMGLLLYSFFPHSGCVYSRNRILDHGGYEGDVFEDYSLWLRIMHKAMFATLPEVLLYQRYRNDSLSRNNLLAKNKIIYDIQFLYYKKLDNYFDQMDIYKENLTKGWREYFYGDKNGARNYWLKYPTYFLRDYRLIPAFLLTFLSRKLLNAFIESRFRYRVKYFLSYFSKENRIMRRDFMKKDSNEYLFKQNE